MTDEELDNEALWKLYSPKPNPWFSSEIVYEGWGTATFEKPSGKIEGKTKIKVEETGKLKVEMNYEELTTDVTIYGDGNFKFLKFLQGNLGKGNAVGIGTNNINPCSGLKVETNEGVFTSEGVIFYSEAWKLDGKLSFWISDGIFDIKDSKKATYWILPLTNFTSSFHINPHYLLAQHPLRLYSTPTIPDIEDKKKKNIALFIANGANTLIGFNFGEKIGYIQPVLEFNERKEKLESGEIKKCITALMISEITNHLEEIWFPYDYTNLLSFASGIKIDAPWVEFRDTDGNLVSRKHITQFDNEYQKEYAVINEAIHGGIGHLISVASNSPEFGKPYYRVLIAHLIRLQSYSRQLEDHMDLLCRTFDTLCEEFNLGTQNLISYFPEEMQIQINSILLNAAKQIKRLSSTDMRPVLQQIADKVISAKSKERAFGIAVIDLLKKYELPDVNIMENYYDQRDETQEKSWAQTLSKYRGAVVHKGYFAHEHYDVEGILQLEDHLHDLLVRIALKTLGYKGNYQPRVIRHLVDEKTVDWLNEESTAANLGYTTPVI